MPGGTPGTDSLAPALRLAQCEDDRPITLSDRRDAHAGRDRPAMRLVENGSPILLAGSDTPRRASLLADLSEMMPEGTVFDELSTLGEVLERAPGSRMVILNGGLEDVSARSLMRILAQRHPSLPVISVDPSDPDDL
ncbi:MAG TPA: hypothetical protein VNY35_10165 [Solirubrobacteraceae bacterium]|nr:hypothetical protein [Solirubrobacteraceae bacterium]